MGLLPDYQDETLTRAEADALDGATVLEFGASWCGYCIGAQPVIHAALGNATDLRHLKIADGPGRPLMGIVDQPYVGERFIGGFGRAEMTGPMGRTALATRKTRALDQATLFSTFPEVGTPEEGAAFARLSQQVRLTRYGMDCYAYALIALGQIDLVVEAGLHPYDVDGPIAVIEAAGGIVTDWQGGPAWRGGRVLAAANPEIHAAAMAVLNG